MDDKPMVIAGGGIAGLAAALALDNGDNPILMLEREEMFSEVGAGLQLGPNAVRALRTLGAWDAVEPMTSQPPEIHIRDGMSGRLLQRVRLGKHFENRFGAPYRVALRADLHAALLTRVRGIGNVTIKNRSGVTGYELRREGAELALANGTMLDAARLIAADGVHSLLRQQMYPGSQPVNSGEVLLRALLQHLPTAKNVSLDCVNLWLCAGHHVVHYPVGRQKKLNIVHGMNGAMTHGTAMAGLCDTLQSILASADRWTTWPGLYVQPLPQWSNGPVTLIGDAAHATLPYLAQGAAMALEDAVALRDGDSELRSRNTRARRLHHETLRAGKIYHLRGATALLRNLALKAMPDEYFLRRMSWIYDYRAE